MIVQLARGRLASGSKDPVPDGRVLLEELLELVAWEPSVGEKSLSYITIVLDYNNYYYHTSSYITTIIIEVLYNGHPGAESTSCCREVSIRVMCMDWSMIRTNNPGSCRKGA